jgi:hypothetical protein
VVLSYAIAVTIATKRLLPSSIAFALSVERHISLKWFLKDSLGTSLMPILQVFTRIL